MTEDPVRLTKEQFTMLRAVSRGGVIDSQAASFVALSRLGFVSAGRGAKPGVAVTENGLAWLQKHPRGGAQPRG